MPQNNITYFPGFEVPVSLAKWKVLKISEGSKHFGPFSNSKTCQIVMIPWPGPTKYVRLGPVQTSGDLTVDVVLGIQGEKNLTGF
jgi:hypothetical protein